MVDFHTNNLGMHQFERDEYVRTAFLQSRPIKRVAGYAGSSPVGDFAIELLTYATVARMAAAESLYVIYRDNRPYKKYIAELLPNTHFEVVEANTVIPMDWFDIGYAADILHNNPEWYNRLYHYPDLMLMPSFRMNPAYFETAASFEVPKANQDRLHDRMIKCGVRDDQWYVCVHIREPSYLYRGADSSRDADAATFRLAAQRIIAAGGQVVRLGHPGCTPLGIEGEISLVNESFDVHAYALSRSRFNLMSDTGMTTIATCLLTPSLVVNGYVKEHLKNDFDRVLLKRVRLADGRILNASDPEFLRLGFPDFNRYLWPRIGNNDLGKLIVEPLLANTAAEIDEATQQMIDHTVETKGWGKPYPVEPIKAQSEFTFPIKIHPPRVPFVTVSRGATLADQKFG